MRDSTFIQNLNSILRDNRNDRYVSNRKSGKIDFKKLHKIERTNTIFKKREARLNKDYYFTFFLDISGSMNQDEKYEENGKTIYIPRFMSQNIIFSDLMKILSQIQGLHIRIILFTDTAFLVKDYQEQFIESEFIEYVNSAFKGEMEDNYDDGTWNEKLSKVNREKFGELYNYKDFPTFSKEIDKTKIRFSSHILRKNSTSSIPRDFKETGKHRLYASGTNILGALNSYPSRYDNELTFIFSDGQFSGDRDDIRRIMNSQKGHFFGVGIQTIEIFNTFGLSNAIYIKEMKSLLPNLLNKIKRSIGRG